MDGLALGVDKRVGLIKRLGRRKPLESRGRRRSRVNDEDRRVVGEGNGELATFDRVGSRERELKRSIGTGFKD